MCHVWLYELQPLRTLMINDLTHTEIGKEAEGRRREIHLRLSRWKSCQQVTIYKWGGATCLSVLVQVHLWVTAEHAVSSIIYLVGFQILSAAIISSFRSQCTNINIFFLMVLQTRILFSVAGRVALCCSTGISRHCSEAAGVNKWLQLLTELLVVHRLMCFVLQIIRHLELLSCWFDMGRQCLLAFSRHNIIFLDTASSLRCWCRRVCVFILSLCSGLDSLIQSHTSHTDALSCTAVHTCSYLRASSEEQCCKRGFVCIYVWK